MPLRGRRRDPVGVVDGLQAGENLGQFARVDDAEPLRGPCQRDVQIVQAARRLGQDAGRVPDQHRVELQPLGLAHGQHHHRALEVGVLPHGRVGQDRLAREFLQSEFWFYPTAFTETFCISALEAQMAGALCIATDLAALQTTVGPRGVLLPGDPASPQYRFAAIDAIRRSVQDPQWRERIVSDAREWAAEQSWDRIASLWLRLLER